MRQPCAIHSFIAFVIFLVLYFVSASLIRFLPGSTSFYVINIFIIQFLAVLAPVFIYAYFKGFDIKRTFYFNLPSLRGLFVSIFVILSGLIIITQIEVLISPLFEIYKEPMKEVEKQIYSIADYNVSLLYLSVAFLPALCEEALFRGFIIRGFVNTAGKLRGIIISALLFGVMHIILPKIIITSILGILFGILLVLTNSIIIPILAHFINNALVIFVMLDSQNRTSDLGVKNDSCICIVVVACFVFIAGLYLLIKEKKSSPKTD